MKRTEERETDLKGKQIQSALYVYNSYGRQYCGSVIGIIDTAVYSIGRDELLGYMVNAPLFNGRDFVNSNDIEWID